MKDAAAPVRLWAWGKRHLLKALVAALAVLSMALAVVMASEEPGWALYLLGLDHLGPEDATRKTRAIELIGIAMGGALLAIGATIANRRAVAMEDAAKAQTAAAKAQADAAMQQAKANEGAEAGRRQERLKTAIEHLGNSSDSVRLGGAYELFHLAQETPDLRQTALDILCAHIRWTTGRAKYQARHAAKPSEEVQSLLTLLLVREHEVFEGCRIDLQGSWLNGAALAGAHLEGANLARTQLRMAYLRDAHLQGAFLVGAQIQGADIRRAYMQSSNLQGAQMQGAYLLGTQMQDTRLIETQMQGVYLHGTELQAASFAKTNLQGAGHNMQFSRDRFVEYLRDGTGKETDLSEVILRGGLDQEKVKRLSKGLPDRKKESMDIAFCGKAPWLHMMLKGHIDKPPSCEPWQGIGIRTGSYTEEEAERWIAEYEQAMGGAPQAGEG